VDRISALSLASSPENVNLIVGHPNQNPGIEEVERLLADDQPGLFAAIGELDWYASSHRGWVDDLDLRPGSSVLEIGCATGTLTAYLADSECNVTGLDRSDDMIDRARNDHPGLDLLVGDATSLPHDNGAFDAVIAASVINVVPDARQVLSEMQRVCAPRGIVSVLVPSAGFTDRDLDDLIETLGVTGFSEAVLTKWHQGPTKMSRKQLETLMRSLGLESIVTHSYLDGMLTAASGTAG
jgi:ubiquinone/menaquinone biosynthesis C-methylase UbiE